ncbi:nol1 nop2 sun family protein, putative [Ichthyophthirius multifiliis]|uniref:Nol1 nop2 sun family protein, putative n=1 Tax=Ichthyophthirius multifiliis TaxID=5932 RepID=G0QQX5_ICHMU|nr:nol1 nop2 sun family protein, putative [Ichthyophthirius multifiliis]EGR32379.1 nol1 nop2 sun family protein, putative [Ichthyophthirius multifiliis]|eukprot:XP_004035865.1 nol1 nop2 sun family protein, putative [Ichthyophthirius multifiliis]
MMNMHINFYYQIQKYAKIKILKNILIFQKNKMLQVKFQDKSQYQCYLQQYQIHKKTKKYQICAQLQALKVNKFLKELKIVKIQYFFQTILIKIEHLCQLFMLQNQILNVLLLHQIILQIFHKLKSLIKFYAMCALLRRWYYQKIKKFIIQMVKQNWQKLALFIIRYIIKRNFLTKVGGQIVYSTCSMNPLENEAVVSAALNILKGFICLENLNISFQDFKKAKIINKWPVVQKKLSNAYWKFEDIQEKYLQIKDKYIFQSMFPQENVDFCLRIHPHLNNTGGFFIAKFQKISHFEQNLIQEYIQRIHIYDFQYDIQEQKNKNEDQLKEFESINIEKLVCLKKNEIIFQQIINFYGIQINDDIFEYLYYHFNENGQLSKHIILLSNYMKNIVDQKQEKYKDLQIINCGIKVLSKIKDQTHEINVCFYIQNNIFFKQLKKYRIKQQGIIYFYDKINKQKISFDNYEDYFYILKQLPKKFDQLPQLIQFQLQNVKNGVVIISINKLKESAFTVWKGINNLSILLSKEEIKVLEFKAKNNLFQKQQ